MKAEAQRWPAVLFLVYAIGLIVLSACKSAEIGLTQIHGLEAWLGGDKSMHLTLSAILAVLACFASERVLDLGQIRRIVCVWCILVACLLIDESAQFLVESRRFELLDLLFGILGLFAGGVVYLLVKSFRSTGKPL